MSRTVLAKTREALRIIGFAGVFALSALIINVLVVAAFVGAFSYRNGGQASSVSPGIEELSDELVLEGSTYHLGTVASEALSKNDETRLESSSGGVFSCFAEKYDVVYGVAMSSDCYSAKMIRTENDISTFSCKSL